MTEIDRITQFAEYLERRSPGRRTAVLYVSDVRQFVATCSKPWREVTLQDMDAFVDQQRQAGLSAATVKRRVAALKVFFDFLAEETGDLRWPNPVRFKRHAGKPPQRLPRDLADQDVARLWAVIAPPRDRAWFVLLWRAGLRLSEVIGLQLDDLLAAPTATRPARLRVCGKGQKERVVLLSAEAYAVLADWLAVRPASPTATIFLNARGQPLTASGLEWLLHQYGAKVDLHVTPHQLRHTYARQLTEAGLPITSLSKLMGHDQISTTQLYLAGADPDLARAYHAALERLAPHPTPAPQAGPAAAVPTAVAAPPTTPPASAPPAAAWTVDEHWAPDLPPALRTATVTLVQRRWPTWAPSRRHGRATKMLGEFRRFWTWQLAQRPIQTLAELQLADLQAYQRVRTAAGVAPGTINVTLKHVLALWRDAAEQGQAVDPSLSRVHLLPVPDSLPRHLSEAASSQLEAYVQARLSSPDPTIRLVNACFFVLAHTGLRAQECVDLQRQDLDLPAGRLRVRLGKGQRERVVYLSTLSQQALDLYLAATPRAPTDPLWQLPDGQPLTYPRLYDAIRAVGQAAGVADVTPHRLRHTLATRLLNSGMDVTRIQKLLGHEHLSTTLIYARVADTTVEHDYRQAMDQVESQQPPLSTTPIAVADWPLPVTADTALALPELCLQPAQLAYNQLDNSV